jgi:phospholipase C
VFIVTYDDTGGFYDHSAVPVGVPAPDDEPACGHNTDFSWLGVRSPTLLISPWVPKGKVSMCSDHSHYCTHTTVLTLLYSYYCTHRGEWAPSVANVQTVL